MTSAELDKGHYLLPGETFRTFEKIAAEKHSRVERSKELLQQQVNESEMVYGKVTRLFMDVSDSGDVYCEAFYSDTAEGWKPTGFIVEVNGVFIILRDPPLDKLRIVPRDEFLKIQRERMCA